MAKQQVGLIGLAVMGENLALNIESRGYSMAVFNRTYQKTEDLINGRAKGKKFFGAKTLQEFVDSLEKPRKIILMVKAGQAVDDFINMLIPLCEKGDLFIDGGNSHFPDTIRRNKELSAKGFLFITLEDESGFANIVVTPDVFERWRTVILEASALTVRGIVQNRNGVVHLRGDHFAPVGNTGFAAGASHDFH